MSSMDPMRDASLIRSEILQKISASTVSLQATGRHKVIIIDEADNTTNDVQLLLRAFTEEFSGNCRFIFTCNFKNKIIEPLHSRCACIDFSTNSKSKPQLAAEFFKRIQEIFMRKVLNMIRRSS